MLAEDFSHQKELEHAHLSVTRLILSLMSLQMNNFAQCLHILLIPHK